MIDLLGKIRFEDGYKLTKLQLKTEVKLEENNLNLFTLNSPTNLAKGIGAHLSNFSKKYPLPAYLCNIDQWINFYKEILNLEKRYRKFSAYPDKELSLYLHHKVFFRKIAYNEVFSKNEGVLLSVNQIKFAKESHSLVGKAKKYLDLELNPYSLSNNDVTMLHEKINELKQGIN